ncbi:254_t:CDS:2, partial [Cetraspora pellucida]
LISYLKGGDSNFWSYKEFLKKNRSTICESPPFTNDWAGLNGRWFERFLQAVKSLNLPNSTSVIDEIEKKNVNDDVRSYWEDVIDERKKAGAVEYIGEEIEDDIRPPIKKLRVDTGKIPDSAEQLCEKSFKILSTGSFVDLRQGGVIDENVDALANFLRLLKAVQSSDHKLYVFIDEYDASMNEALRNKTILTHHQKKENAIIKNKIELIESFNISSNLVLLDEFWDLYGFKKSEIEFLLDNIFGNSFSFSIKNRIMKWLKDKYAEYYFNPDQQKRNDDINLLCRFVEQVLLKPLKDNSIKHSNEKALKQKFLDALVLTLYADIEPEFRVNFQSNYLYGKTINLVKISTEKRIAIEFDNIKMECIKFDRIRDSWQEATRSSLSLMKKSENEILNLKINDLY